MSEGLTEAAGDPHGPEDLVDPWSLNLARFVLGAANVTILPVDGEMLVQHGLGLVVHEGRQEELRDDHLGRPAASILAYVMRIAIEGAAEPEAWTGSDANIVITGMHSNGSMVTIAGLGLAGWDDAAGLQVEFSTPPQMTAQWPT